MTTAARPTYYPAVGDEDRVSKVFGHSRMYSARDQPGQLKMKTRRDVDKDRDLKEDLKSRERSHFEKTGKDMGELESSHKKQPQSIDDLPPDIDADDEDDVDVNPDADSDASDDEDDEAELMAELERIKQERHEEEVREEIKKKAEETKAKHEQMMTGNPLLNLGDQGGANPSFAVKRKWNEDVVFRNQSRSEPEEKKRFINDPLRNDFHKRFLKKYIR
eukprot:Rmarinus@m.6944